jgi:hypothetical protein
VRIDERTNACEESKGQRTLLLREDLLERDVEDLVGLLLRGLLSLEAFGVLLGRLLQLLDLLESLLFLLLLQLLLLLLLWTTSTQHNPRVSTKTTTTGACVRVRACACACVCVRVRVRVSGRRRVPFLLRASEPMAEARADEPMPPPMLSSLRA